MPPPIKSKEAPDNLRPYLFHGLDLSWKDKDKDAVGDCPWCGREGKFGVKIATGVWSCFVCQEGSGKGGGNATVFVRSLHKLAMDITTLADYITLQKERKLLTYKSLQQWGICKSPITGEWMVPGYSVEGAVNNIYKYVPLKDSKGITKNKLLLTPTLGHQIHGMNLWRDNVQIVDVCEGPWDGVAWWEMCHNTQLSEDGIITPYKSGQRISDLRNVVAVPGTKTFLQSWIDKLAGKIVYLWYDNDHPRKENGRDIEPAGIEGMKKVASMLYQSANPPEEIYYNNWGEHGYDLQLANGYDIRDDLRNYNA